jgi:excisionase family DNA binding protein
VNSSGAVPKPRDGATHDRAINTERIQRMTPTRERYLTTGEVARLFHVGEKTVLRWAKLGKLPCVRTLGGQRRFPEQAISIIRAGREVPLDAPDEEDAS